jgi:hypothetical protein
MVGGKGAREGSGLNSATAPEEGVSANSETGSGAERVATAASGSRSRGEEGDIGDAWFSAAVVSGLNSSLILALLRAA